MRRLTPARQLDVWPAAIIGGGSAASIPIGGQLIPEIRQRGGGRFALDFVRPDGRCLGGFRLRFRKSIAQECIGRVRSRPDALVIVPLATSRSIHLKDGGPVLANHPLGPVGAGSHFAPTNQGVGFVSEQPDLLTGFTGITGTLFFLPFCCDVINGKHNGT